MWPPVPAELKRLLRDACEQTFNCISIDGDTSTNDTVLLLASGRSGVRLKPAIGPEKVFRKRFCRSASLWLSRSCPTAKE